MRAIFDFILGAAFFIGVLYLLQFFNAFLAKFLNINIVSKRGTKIATPKDFDANIEAIKNYKNDVKNLLSKTIYKINRGNSSRSISEKLRLLKELDDLKNRSILTESEFNELRSKIIK
jgi:hypothetical protein